MDRLINHRLKSNRMDNGGIDSPHRTGIKSWPHQSWGHSPRWPIGSLQASKDVVVHVFWIVTLFMWGAMGLRPIKPFTSFAGWFMLGFGCISGVDSYNGGYWLMFCFALQGLFIQLLHFVFSQHTKFQACLRENNHYVVNLFNCPQTHDSTNLCKFT